MTAKQLPLDPSPPPGLQRIAAGFCLLISLVGVGLSVHLTRLKFEMLYTPCLSAYGGCQIGGYTCDDALMSTHPGASEVCNAINDDCDTTTDELCANGLAAGTGQSSIQFSTYNATGGDVSGMCPAGQYAVGVRVHLVRLDGQLAPGYLNGIAAICAISAAVCAETSEGLRTTVFPPISAEITGRTASWNGKFHGAMMPTTPRGKCSM